MTFDSNTTIDSKEIDHFNKVKTLEEWWDPNKTRVLHAMNTVRVPFVVNGLVNTGVISSAAAKTGDPLKGLRILDVGSGAGLVAEPLAQLGATVTGLEPCSELIDIAKRHAALNPAAKSIRYIEGTIEDHIKDHGGFYDAVIASEVIEHVVNPEFFTKSCVAAVKPGGSFFVTTPGQSFISWLLGIKLAEDVLKIIPKGTHSYDKFISPDHLQQMLEKDNCKTVQVNGSYYNPLTNAFSWTSYTGLYYCLHAVKTS